MIPNQVAWQVSDMSQIGGARRHAAQVAEAAGFDESDTGRVALAATELATNLVRHAGRGQLLVQVVHTPAVTIELLSIDSGPGMRDTAACMVDGFSSRSTPGGGLGAVRRLSVEFDIYSQPGNGCIVMARIGRASDVATLPARGSLWRWGAINLPAPGETACGDTWRIGIAGESLTLLVADGLGHGPLAAEAANAAAAVFAAAPTATTASLFEKAHRSNRHLRGLAMAVAVCSAQSGAMTYTGVGNIAGTLVSRDGARRGLMSHNGTVGAEMRTVRELPYQWEQRDLLIMHSDGLQSRWNTASYTGLHDRHPAVIAAVLLRDHLRGKDDATVVVVERTK